MKVCVPTVGHGGLSDLVGGHFGKVPTYTIVDTETKEVKVIENTSEHYGGVGLPPELIRAAGADVMIVSALGQRAVALFQELGIHVYVGAKGTVKDALVMLENEMLVQATDENACKEHAMHDRH
jgi:predicted Fe-Mo cluster-binding NifX family protein